MALQNAIETSVAMLSATAGAYSSTSAIAQAFEAGAKRYAGYLEATLRSTTGILTANFQHAPTDSGPWRTLLTTSIILNQATNVVYESQSVINPQALAAYGRITLACASEGNATRFDTIVARMLTDK